MTVAARSNTVGLAVLVLTAVPGFWSAFLPSLHDIATTDQPATTVKWVRRGEVQAVGLSLSVGVGAALLAREPWPLLGAAAMCVYLAWLYEGALKHGAPAAS